MMRVCSTTSTYFLTWIHAGVVTISASLCAAAPLPLDTTAAQLVQHSDVAGGLVAHIGGGSVRAYARMTAGLRANTHVVVHGLYQGDAVIDEVRRELREQSDEGAVTVEAWRGADLPYTDNLVNLLVCSGKAPDEDEILRVLVPGGVALIREANGYTRCVKPRPEAIDDWTHLLYDAGNNAVSRDRVVAAPHRVQWVAAPLNARHHERLGTVSVAVSSGGRLFYIIDEAPAASILLPPAWALVARDAFNGVVLWKHSITRWEEHLRPFRSGPPELSRTLVAASEAVYVTLGQRALVSALDAATGETLHAYTGTHGTEEILFRDGILYLATRQGDAATSPRGIMAVDAQTGDVAWRRDDADPLPMSLTMADSRVVYMSLDAVTCLDATTGSTVWFTPRDVAGKRPAWSAPTVVLHDGVVLVADRWTAFKDALDEVTGKPVARWLAQEGWTGDLIAYSADTGEPLWRCSCAETYHSPPDVFVIDGLVWVGQSRSRTGPDFVAGRDLHTGEIRRTLDTAKAWDTTMPHHRCHRNRATSRYIITGRTGVEFIDLLSGESRRHHWTRGTCQFGTLPCNGLLYLPPHACACFIESKLTGFLALAPQRNAQAGPRKPEGPEKGPAYGLPLNLKSARSDLQSSAWPTYRHDALRSGYAPQKITAELGVLWEAPVGGRISSPVVADGKVFVASVDEHNVHAFAAESGEPAWRFTAGGRVDSPPTYAAGRIVFGANDGYVYCLDSHDGRLAWRFRAGLDSRRVMAFGRVESAWPVHGSVLVLNDTVYCVAGRSSYLDGGLILYRLDLKSGDVRAHRQLASRDAETGEQPGEPIMFEMPGALPDVLSSDGKHVYMRHLAFDRETLDDRPAGKHVYSPAGFLNGDWWHRTYWIDGNHFYSGYIGWYFAGHEVPAGRLLTFTGTKLYGYGYAPGHYRGATGREYHLFALDRATQPAQPPADYLRANRDYPHSGKGKSRVTFDWSQRVPLLVRSMVLTADKLFVAGPPEAALTSRPAYDGKVGGRLIVAATADGAALREFELDALPVYDGMAAAGNRLFLALQDGRLLCMGEGGKQTAGLTRVTSLADRLPPLTLTPEDGLAGYWRFDEGCGKRARDSSGGNHAGSVDGEWATGVIGACVRAAGLPGVFTLPDGLYLQPGPGDFTLDFWVNVEGHDCRLLGKETFPKNWWVVNVLPDGRSELVLGCGTGADRALRAKSKTELLLNTWTHIVYVVNRSTRSVTCWINGRSDKTTPVPPELDGIAFDVKGTALQVPSAHKPFRGLFDEFRFYRRALAGDEIAARHAAVLGRK